MKPITMQTLKLVLLFGIAALIITAMILAIHAMAENEEDEDPDLEHMVTTFEVEVNPDLSDDSTDWYEQLTQAVIDGDSSAGGTAEFRICASRGDTLITYDNVYLLAKIMTAEEGIDWPDWVTMAIGEVVLNRVASTEFPDTIEEVIMQNNPIQYEPVWNGRWEVVEPTERNIRLAMRLLQGERVLNDESIVFQALFTQGSATIVSYYDLQLGSTTYFCRSNYPELYGA